MTDSGDDGEGCGRINALRRYHDPAVTDDAELASLGSIAAILLKLPLALISFVDSDQVWLEHPSHPDLEKCGLAARVCRKAVETGRPCAIPDAMAESRTAGNPPPGDDGFRSCAAVPLTTHDGYHIGAFCVMDHCSREFAATELEVLQTLAAAAMQRLEVGHSKRVLASRIEALEELHESRDRAVATLAHDLRNCLGSSVLMVKLLMEEKLGPLNSRQRQMVESIGSACDDVLARVKSGLERNRPGECREDPECPRPTA